MWAQIEFKQFLMENLRCKIFLICVLVFVCISKVKGNDIYFKIGNNHSALPFARFSKLAYKNFHFSYELGKSFTLKQNEKGLWFQTANVGYFKHKFVQSGILLYSENGYQRNITEAFGINTKLGLGYMHAFTATAIVKQNSQGDYEVKADYGKPQAIFAFSLGVSRSLIKRVSNAPKITLDYQIRMQTPFVKSYVPLLPYNVLKIGLSFPLHDKKS